MMDKSKKESVDNATRAKKIVEPLCLFYFNHQEGENASKHETARAHYEASTNRSKPTRTQRGLRLAAKTLHSSSGDTDEADKPKRASFRSRRKRDGVREQKHKVKRFGREKPHNLTSYLLSSVKTVAGQLPPLTDVLTTIQDAWPTQNLQLCREEDEGKQKLQEDSMKLSTSQTTKMLEVPIKMVRRRSVPEEIIRKFVVSKEQTSPESETTVTMPEPSSSGKEAEESTARVAAPEKERPVTKSERIRASCFAKRVGESNERDEWIERSFRIMEEPERSAEEGSSDSDSDAPGMERFNTIKRAPLRRESVIDNTSIGGPPGKSSSQGSSTVRVSQKDFYRNGQGILRPRVSEKYCQTGECTCRSNLNDSGTTPSAHEETESAESSDTISSPTLCTRQLTSSDNQSSDSEGIPCTCAELTSSKDTSTDPYHSGKSTLSQTVSDKSVSTQDSTMSIKSVSTGGSSISAVSGSSSPDLDPKTSAKETTTSPDHTPRSPRKDNGRDGGRSNAKRGGQGHQRDGNEREQHDRSCPRYNQYQPQKESRNYRQNADFKEQSKCHKKERTVQKIPEESIAQDSQPKETARTYEWAARSAEETSVRQEQLQSRFLDNNRQFITPLPGMPLVVNGTVSMCSGAGSSYHSTANVEDLPLMVPRYSALPRSLSMVVNTSSIEVSHNSDSESIADSLEGEKNENQALYFDTKNETKPVRGDVNEAIKPRTKWKFNHPRGNAYFVSIDKDAEEEIVTDIYKIPEPPEKIKNRIFERHANICKNRESRDKMHLKNEMPTPKPTFTKRIRKERKKKQKELKEAEKEQKSKKLLPGLKRTKGSKRMKTTDAKEAKLSTECDPIPKVAPKASKIGERTIRQEKSTLSKIPILVKSPSSSPDRIVKNEDSTAGVKNGQINSAEGVIDGNYLAPMKPHAVIHPSPTSLPLNSQVDLEALQRHRMSLISSLESTATILKAQQQNTTTSTQHLTKNQTAGAKRPNNKFQQKFEVIPEERSSSLSSSADDRYTEKDRRRSLPVKLTEASTSPNLLTPDMEGKSFRRYSLGSLSNYIISKLMGRPLQAIPCVQRGPNNENQQIIVFSPKDTSKTNSAKGRDALIAMNREDFDRLSKGWMNFYLLKQDSDDEIALGEELTHSFSFQEEQELLKSEATSLSPRGNTIICRIPSMEKDPTTTSGSGTDETGISPGNYKQPNFDFENFKKRYSLLLKDAGTDCFELQECPSEAESLTKSSDFSDNTIHNKVGSPKKKEQLTNTNEPNDRIKNFTKNYEAENGLREKILTQDETVDKLTQDEKEKNKVTSTNECTSKDSRKEKDGVMRSLRSTKEAATSTKKRAKPIGRPPPCERNENLSLPEDLKFNSSNTVLRTMEIISVPSKRSTGRLSNRTSRGLSLPELPVESKRKSFLSKTISAVESLPRVAITSGSEDMDSDSTVYMQAPSPQVPPLPLEDCRDWNSDELFSTSSDEEGRTKPTKPMQRVPNPIRPRTRAQPNDSKYSHKTDKSGWSVTVAGSVEFPNSTPDVQMRLSFPSGGGPPLISQSDSGFVEERLARSRAATQRKQEWTVTVKNPRAGRTKEKHRTVLPTLNLQATERTTKRVPKAKSEELELETIVRKMPEIWSKVQGMIEEELKFWKSEVEWQKREEESFLVSGRAMPFDSKPRPTKMSDRDVTRNSTARTNSVQRSSQVQE